MFKGKGLNWVDSIHGVIIKIGNREIARLLNK